MTQSDITVLLTGPTRGIGAAVVDRLVHRTTTSDLVLVGRRSDRLAAAVDRQRALEQGGPFDLLA